MRRSASSLRWACKFTAIDEINASLDKLDRTRPAVSQTQRETSVECAVPEQQHSSTVQPSNAVAATNEDTVASLQQQLQQMQALLQRSSDEQNQLKAQHAKELLETQAQLESASEAAHALGQLQLETSIQKEDLLKSFTQSNAQKEADDSKQAAAIEGLQAQLGNSDSKESDLQAETDKEACLQIWRHLLSCCVAGERARVSYDTLMCIGKGLYSGQYCTATNDEFTRMLFGCPLKQCGSLSVCVDDFLESAVAMHMFDRFCLSFNGSSMQHKKERVALLYSQSGVAIADPVVGCITECQIALVDREERFNDLFDRVDENGDGAIDFNEMMLFGIALNQSDPGNEWTWERQRECWEQMDLDGNGTIDRSEFAFFYRSVIYDYDEQRFNETMSDYEGAAKGICSPPKGPSGLELQL